MITIMVTFNLRRHTLHFTFLFDRELDRTRWKLFHLQYYWWKIFHLHHYQNSSSSLIFSVKAMTISLVSRNWNYFLPPWKVMLYNSLWVWVVKWLQRGVRWNMYFLRSTKNNAEQRIRERNYLTWCKKMMKFWRILLKGLCIMCIDKAIPLLEGMSSKLFCCVG